MKRTYNWQTQAQVIKNRQLVLDAFKELRKVGMICRANFSCCSGCAGAEIAHSVDQMTPARRAKVAGAIFWHHQDDERATDSGNLFITYGPVELYKVGTFGGSAEEVGGVLANALRQKGLTVDWDGDGNNRIIVDLTADGRILDAEVDERNWRVAESRSFSESK